MKNKPQTYEEVIQLLDLVERDYTNQAQEAWQECVEEIKKGDSADIMWVHSNLERHENNSHNAHIIEYIYSYLTGEGGYWIQDIWDARERNIPFCK